MPFPVFLSSLTAQMPVGAENLRERVFREAGQSMLIYVDERIHTRSIPVPDSLVLSDELLSRVSEATCFLCILAGSSCGSPLSLHNYDVSVSYFEIELFAAALQRKPIHLLVHSSFKPNSALQSLLDILHFAFPDWRNISPLDDQQLVDAASRVAADAIQAPKRRTLIALSSSAGRIAQSLYTARGRNRQRVLFLGGQQIGNNREPDLDVVRRLLTDASARENQEQRLSRLWLAVRELNTPSINLRPDPNAISLLEEALEQWSGAGAWYGLNADMHLGCVAALNVVHDLRQKRKVLGALGAGVHQYPAGALASAKFNVAKHLTSIADRRARLRDAFEDIQVALSQEMEDSSGLYAVRASINRKLGHVFDAASDLERSLAIRRQMGIQDLALGSTFSELGFAYLYSLRLRKGLKLCEEGVTTLRVAKSNTTDLARALRKLAVAYAVNGKLSKYRSALEESQILAAKSNVHDQRR